METDRRGIEGGGMTFTFNPVPKSGQLFNNRKGKPNQRKRGAISPSVREEVRNRSKGLCEVRKRCAGSQALEMAHTKSRNTIDATTSADLLHACVECHRWMDTQPDGIKYKRMLRERDAV